MENEGCYAGELGNTCERQAEKSLTEGYFVFISMQTLKFSLLFIYGVRYVHVSKN